MPKRPNPDDPSMLTDAEADFVLLHCERWFREAIAPAEFHEQFRAGVRVGIRASDRERARDWVRLFVRAER